MSFESERSTRMNRVEFATVGVDSETRSKVSGRYKRITRAVNGEFWGSQSEIEHTLQVGSCDLYRFLGHAC